MKLIILTLILFTLSVEVFAKRTYGMRPAVYAKIQEIQIQLDESQWQHAIEAINDLQKRKLSQYELAQTWDIQGIAYYQIKDYHQAISTYSQILSVKEYIPEGMYQRTIRTLTQLNLMQEDYDNALKYGLLLIESQQDADAYMLVAQAHFRMKSWASAITASNKALELLGDKKPKENWLLLQNAIYYATQNFPQMLKVLEKLILWYPKDDYLLYTANVYGELGQTSKQTSLLEALYEKGVLTNKNELINLASLYLLEKVPLKCAHLLQAELQSNHLQATEKVYELLATAWRSAGEEQKSIESMLALAELSQKGTDYLRLAYQYFDINNWEESAKYAEIASNQLDLELENQSKTYMLLGMSYLNMKRFESAKQAFMRASKDASQQKLSKQWLIYTKREAQKYQQLATTLTVKERI